jgi:hypothetical protein
MPWRYSFTHFSCPYWRWAQEFRRPLFAQTLAKELLSRTVPVWVHRCRHSPWNGGRFLMKYYPKAGCHSTISHPKTDDNKNITHTEVSRTKMATRAFLCFLNVLYPQTLMYRAWKLLKTSFHLLKGRPIRALQICRTQKRRHESGLICLFLCSSYGL